MRQTDIRFVRMDDRSATWSTTPTPLWGGQVSYDVMKAFSHVCFNENAPWRPVHRSSIPGDCNVDAVRSHNPGLTETPPCILVPA